MRCMLLGYTANKGSDQDTYLIIGPLSLYYSMHKKIDLHQIRANFWHTRILLSVPDRKMQLEKTG